MNKERNMNGMQNPRHNGSANGESPTRVANFDEKEKAALLEKIREMSFVKTELELYLDTHPGCGVALDYYYRTIDALREARSKYSTFGSPLFASEVEGDSWSWVNSPWPWDRVLDEKNGKWEK